MTSKARQQLRAAQAAKAARKRVLRIVGTATVLVVVVAAILVTVFVFKPWETPVGPAGAVGQPPNGNAKAIVVNPGKAPASAPLVEIFLDYQCPNCRVMETAYGPEFEKLAEAGTIQLQYRTMTFLDQNLQNDSSTRAAVAAACADTVGVYPAYHDQVFANQPQEGLGYSDAVLRQTIPAAVGLSGDKLTTFQQCYDTRATAPFVTQVADQALKDGVHSTPTVHVNGKDFSPGAPADLGAAIAQAAG